MEELKQDDDKKEFTALSFTGDSEDSLWNEIDEWLEDRLFPGWFEIELVSIVFSPNTVKHQAVVTFKGNVNTEGFEIDEDDNSNEEPA